MRTVRGGYCSFHIELVSKNRCKHLNKKGKKILCKNCIYFRPNKYDMNYERRWRG